MGTDPWWRWAEPPANPLHGGKHGWDGVKVKTATAVQQNQRSRHWRQVVDRIMVILLQPEYVAGIPDELRRICGIGHQIANNLRRRAAPGVA
ncbi:hypothetical protein [Stenotrophomonas tumulicola]|uniref:Uncharacterized protein n=1 Tax=Stenotrophomonas tumulicola TaxID=1685415 RepID=A0A7W3IHK2_9GAMM|nr:hypothetical protein [Stenotrophomonas tumulicola]MBA8682100.1 hypothetical protein [Stenotrophomonas tumulicola]